MGLNDVVDSDDRDRRVACVLQRLDAHTVVRVICVTSSEETGGGGGGANSVGLTLANSSRSPTIIKAPCRLQIRAFELPWVP